MKWPSTGKGFVVTIISRLSTQLEPTLFVRTLGFRISQIACVSLYLIGAYFGV